MGILNVTPDSFSDGGLHDTFDKAIARGIEMLSEGVDIIDIGGESTRPGAMRVSAEVEQERVLPVIQYLAKVGAAVSVDTMRADTAAKAIQRGARYVNDVSGGGADPEMFNTVANLGCEYILMHWRGRSEDMNTRAVYDDVVAQVIEEVNIGLLKALAAGISQQKIILDPGLGFAKEAHHNWEIIDRLDEFIALGYPVLIGGSRKRFLGGTTLEEREVASIELTRTLLKKDVWGVRVHTVKPHRDVMSKQ